jgi:hypothetical protein
MFGFFRRRKYRAAAVADIKRLFAAMPKDHLATAKQLVNVEGAINLNFRRGTPARECAIYCAAFLTAAPIQRMDQETRDDLLRRER